MADQAQQEATFTQYFPQASFRPIAANEIAGKALKHFEEKGHLFIDRSQSEVQQLNNFFIVEHGDDTQTYVARHIKGDKHCLYLYDTNNQGAYIGHGEIQFNTSSESDQFKDKPFMMFTVTNEDFRRKGYGLRRLYLMNALSHTLYNLPLHSDILTSNGTEMEWKQDVCGVWKKAVTEGRAEAYEENSETRYAFLQ